MANYPQLDNASGVWNLREVYDAVMGGYWPNANSRALVMGGFTPGQAIESYNFQTKATPTIFGNLSFAGQTYYAASFGSLTRAIIAGGDNSPANTDTIAYGVFATEGNFADFGNLTSSRSNLGGVSNSIRGVAGGGNDPSVSNVIDYVTLASAGNASDFGDLTQSRGRIGSTGNPTRALWCGGYTPSYVNTIDFVEIMTTGNATDFGDLARTGGQLNYGSISSSTRGVVAGGFNPSLSDEIQKIEIASQGNAIDYGDLSGTAGLRLVAGASNSVTGVLFAGYNGAPGYVNYIQDFNIASGGTAVQVGANTINNGAAVGTSGCHGGLNDGFQGTRPIPFNEAGGDLGLYFGGEPASSPIQFINISSTGNANDFSGVTVGAIDTNGGGNKTRGMIYSGNDGSGNTDDIKYVEFATKGNVAFFGNATAAKQIAACASNNTRLLAGGGATPSNVNNIDQITISTFGNASDFGDLTASRKPLGAGSSNTRAVWGGGNNPDPTNVMDYVTISTTGNAADFGDLTVARRNGASANSTTRILFAGGRSNPSPAAESNVIDYITTATTGDATDFGDLTSSRIGVRGVSNTTRGCFMGGTETPGGNVNIIDFVTIGSTGNASDFGDIIAAGRGGATASNGHGGLVGG